jgi:hypothetical protein
MSRSGVSRVGIWRARLGVRRVSAGRTRATILGALLASLAATAAAEEPSTASTALAEELAATVQRWIDAGWLPDPVATGTPFVLDLPAGPSADLGLLVSGSDPLVVRSVRPGGWAQRAGLAVGDRIVAVDGVPVSGPERPGGAGARLRGALLASAPGATVELRVLRDGRELALSAPSPVRALPAIRLAVGADTAISVAGGDGSTSARLSTFPSPPVQGGVFDAAIQAIDGRAAGPADAATVRVEPGLRLVRLSERIPAAFRPAAPVRRSDRDGTIEFALWVEPGRTYLLGARPIGVGGGRGGYWEPVVWRTVAEPCR